MRNKAFGRAIRVVTIAAVLIAVAAGAQAGDTWQWSITPYMWATDISEDLILDGEVVGVRRRLPGECAGFGVSRPVNQGGWGALELALRYSRLDLTDGSVDGGEMEILSLGVAWWFTRSTNFSLNYRQNSLERDDTRGNSSGLNARLQLILD